MSAKKKPEPAAPAAQEPQQEEKGADPAADSQPDAKSTEPADAANQPTDTEPPAGPDAEPAPQQDPEPPAQEEASPTPQAEGTAAPDTELAQVKAALLAANCEIAAYKAGVDSAMVADAITLARAEAGPGADEAAIAAAIATSFTLPETFQINKIGVGAGKRNYEVPGILRVMEIQY